MGMMNREKIEDYLIEKQIKPSVKGFDYLVVAIQLMNSDISYKRAITKRLYPDVAKEFNDTPSVVERAIRHAIDSSKSTMKNSEFICLAQIEIRRR